MTVCLALTLVGQSMSRERSQCRKGDNWLHEVKGVIGVIG